MSARWMGIVAVLVMSAAFGSGFGCQLEEDPTGSAAFAVECSEAGSCATGELCVAGWCMPTCASDADCPAGLCVDGLCDFTPTPWVCEAGADCPAGAVCEAGVCVWAGCTPVPETCNGLDDDCDGLVDEGIELATDPANCGACGSACAAGMTCVDGVCVAGAACVTDADCAAGTVCVAGVCAAGAACVTDADCAAGTVCMDGVCVAGAACVTDADCAAGTACVAGLCVAGAACVTDADCDDGLFCTSWASCIDGVCVVLPDIVCDDGDPATVDVCDEGTDTCRHEPAGPCTPVPEACNGLDDDCDGMVDEDFDLATDPAHCGACGSACSAGMRCADGVCTA